MTQVGLKLRWSKLIALYEAWYKPEKAKERQEELAQIEDYGE